MTTHRIGYARVSTRDQNLDLQRDALQKAGCDKIYKDTISGTKSQRPGLDQALDNLREGDTLVVWKLDRLGRSVKDLLDFAGGLNNRGVGFVSLTDAIDTTTASGRFFFVEPIVRVRTSRHFDERSTPGFSIQGFLGILRFREW